MYIMEAPPGSSNTSKSGSNAFVNDGSFMEQFRRMQELQQQKQQANKADVSAGSTKSSGFSSVPLLSTAKTRVTKSGTVVMKLSGVKKKSEKAKKLPTAGVSKAFKEGSSSESEGEGVFLIKSVYFEKEKEQLNLKRVLVCVYVYVSYVVMVSVIMGL